MVLSAVHSAFLNTLTTGTPSPCVSGSFRQWARRSHAFPLEMPPVLFRDYHIGALLLKSRFVINILWLITFDWRHLLWIEDAPNEVFERSRDPSSLLVMVGPGHYSIRRVGPNIDANLVYICTKDDRPNILSHSSAVMYTNYVCNYTVPTVCHVLNNRRVRKSNEVLLVKKRQIMQFLRYWHSKSFPQIT